MSTFCIRVALLQKLVFALALCAQAHGARGREPDEGPVQYHEFLDSGAQIRPESRNEGQQQEAATSSKPQNSYNSTKTGKWGLQLY